MQCSAAQWAVLGWTEVVCLGVEKSEQWNV